MCVFRLLALSKNGVPSHMDYILPMGAGLCSTCVIVSGALIGGFRNRFLYEFGKIWLLKMKQHPLDTHVTSLWWLEGCWWKIICDYLTLLQLNKVNSVPHHTSCTSSAQQLQVASGYSAGQHRYRTFSLSLKILMGRAVSVLIFKFLIYRIISV